MFVQRRGRTQESRLQVQQNVSRALCGKVGHLRAVCRNTNTHEIEHTEEVPNPDFTAEEVWCWLSKTRSAMVTVSAPRNSRQVKSQGIPPRTSRTTSKVQKSRSCSVLVTLGETFARTIHRKGRKFEDLEQFLTVLQTRCGNIPVYCDQEECLRDVYTVQSGNWDSRQR